MSNAKRMRTAGGAPSGGIETDAGKGRRFVFS
jgi:hypothetical protein